MPEARGLLVETQISTSGVDSFTVMVGPMMNSGTVMHSVYKYVLNVMDISCCKCIYIMCNAMR